MIYQAISYYHYHYRLYRYYKMYNEEYLPQSDVIVDNTVMRDDVSVSVSSDDDTTVIEKKFDAQYRKMMDTGYRKEKVHINGQPVRIESYASDIHKLGGRIRHAVTGFRTPHVCGTSDENAYFSVMDVRNGPESRKLYYHTPDEYERHFKTVVPQETKEKWLTRRIALC